MLPTCLAKIRDPQKALPLSWLAWFSRLFYIYRVLYFLCFFPLYRVVLTVYVREELGCRFYWLFALLSATVCGSLGLCFFFLFILCLMPLICCAFSFCHWAFLLWVPSDYFLLQYFDLYFFCCVHCGLTFFFYLPGDQPIGRMAFTLFCLCFCFLFYVIKLHSPRFCLVFLAPPHKTLCTTHVSILVLSLFFSHALLPVLFHFRGCPRAPLLCSLNQRAGID